MSGNSELLRRLTDEAVDERTYRKSPGNDVPLYESYGGIVINGPGGQVRLGRQRWNDDGAEWYRIVNVDGLWDLPGVRQQRSANPDTHGQSGGAISLDERVVAIEGMVHAGSLRGLRAMERRLKSVVAPRRQAATTGPQLSINVGSGINAVGDLQWPASALISLSVNDHAMDDLDSIFANGGGGITRVTTDGVHYSTSVQNTASAGSAAGIEWNAPEFWSTVTPGDDYGAGVWVKVTAAGGSTATNLTLRLVFTDQAGNELAPVPSLYSTNVKAAPTTNSWYWISDVWTAPPGASRMKLRISFSGNHTSTATFRATESLIADVSTESGYGSASIVKPYAMGPAYNGCVSVQGEDAEITATTGVMIGPVPHNMISYPRGEGDTHGTPSDWQTINCTLLNEQVFSGVRTPPHGWFEDPDAEVAVVNLYQWKMTPDGVGGMGIKFGQPQPVTPLKPYYVSCYVKPMKTDADFRVVMAGTSDYVGANEVAYNGPTTACPRGQWTLVEGVMAVDDNKPWAFFRLEQVGTPSTSDTVYAIRPMAAATNGYRVDFLDEHMHGFELRTPKWHPTYGWPAPHMRYTAGYILDGDVADLKMAQRHDKPGVYQLPFMLTIKCGDPRIYELNMRNVRFDFPTIPAAAAQRPALYQTTQGTYNPNFRMVTTNGGWNSGYGAYGPGLDPGEYMDVNSDWTYLTPDWGLHAHTGGESMSPVPPAMNTPKHGGASFVPNDSTLTEDMMVMAGFSTMGQWYFNNGPYMAGYASGMVMGVVLKQLASGERLECGIIQNQQGNGRYDAGVRPHLAVWQVYPNAATPGGWRMDVIYRSNLLWDMEFGDTSGWPGNREYWIRAGIYNQYNWPDGLDEWDDRFGIADTNSYIFWNISNGRPTSIHPLELSQNISRDVVQVPTRKGDGAVGQPFGHGVQGKRGWVITGRSTLSPWALLAWEERLINTPAPQSRTLFVAGDVETQPRITFVGPLTDPRVTINGNPVALKGEVPDGAEAYVDLATGDFYGAGATIDPTTRGVDLLPGDNDVVAEATGTTAGTSSIRIDYRPAWT